MEAKKVKKVVSFVILTSTSVALAQTNAEYQATLKAAQALAATTGFKKVGFCPSGDGYTNICIKSTAEIVKTIEKIEKSGKAVFFNKWLGNEYGIWNSTAFLKSNSSLTFDVTLDESTQNGTSVLISIKRPTVATKTTGQSLEDKYGARFSNIGGGVYGAVKTYSTQLEVIMFSTKSNITCRSVISTPDIVGWFYHPNNPGQLTVQTEIQQGTYVYWKYAMSNSKSCTRIF